MSAKQPRAFSVALRPDDGLGTNRRRSRAGFENSTLSHFSRLVSRPSTQWSVWGWNNCQRGQSIRLYCFAWVMAKMASRRFSILIQDIHISLR
nr:hypothetical protein CFP56_21917 [Quercus suber]